MAERTNQQYPGSALLAKRMGKTRVIAETGAGQHGVATAIACAALWTQMHSVYGYRGLRASTAKCLSYATAKRRGSPVDSGSKTLKDSINEAFRDW
jgi:tryptophan synthase beta chain